MVHNFLAGGAAVNAFAAQVGAEVLVVDVGVAADLAPAAGLLPRKVARGTADFTAGPAMSGEQALGGPARWLGGCARPGGRGEPVPGHRRHGHRQHHGLRRTVCAFTGADPAAATGRGTGVDAATFARKVEVICQGLALHEPDPSDPVGVLAAVGGLRARGARRVHPGRRRARVPVILDGVIAGGGGARCVRARARSARAACIAGHRSNEPGTSISLDHLGLRPLVDLEPAPRRGNGRAARAPAGAERGPRRARGRHVRLGRGDGEELIAEKS